jgi:hypothetical protein
MKNVTWKTVIEAAGILAIVVSLVFVGLQLRQSQEIAIAAQYQARAQAAQSMYMSLQESGTSLKGRKPVTEMTPFERYTAENVNRWAWTQSDNLYFQYNAGFLDEESLDGMKYRVERVFSACDRRYIWEDMRKFLRPSFVSYVEGLTDNCKSNK